MSLVILVSQGGAQLGTGLGPPDFLDINLLVALISLVILLSPAAKALSLDTALVYRSPRLAPSSSTAVRVAAAGAARRKQSAFGD